MDYFIQPFASSTLERKFIGESGWRKYSNHVPSINQVWYTVSPEKAKKPATCATNKLAGSTSY